MTDTTGTDRAMREIPLGPDGEVELLLTSNELRLRGTDGDRVVIRGRGGRALDDELTIESGTGFVRIRDGGAGELRIGPLRMRARPSMDLDIDLPRTARVSVRTLSGDIEAQGIGGASRWATASGDLRLAVEGGPVSIESMSGDIVLDASVAVALTARSVSGDLHLRAPLLDAISAATTSGDVDIDAALGDASDHVISSVSGDVRLVTASDVRLEAQTVSGDIRSSGTVRGEGGRGRRTLVAGEGRVRVSVRTMSGDIVLRGGTAPASVSPQPPAAPRPPAAPAPAVPPAPVEPPVVVSEASAAPNLIRPSGAASSSTDQREAARLEVLRALGRGDLDIEAASLRLEALEDAGPRAFRGWC